MKSTWLIWDDWVTTKENSFLVLILYTCLGTVYNKPKLKWTMMSEKDSVYSMFFKSSRPSIDKPNLNQMSGVVNLYSSQNCFSADIFLGRWATSARLAGGQDSEWVSTESREVLLFLIYFHDLVIVLHHLPPVERHSPQKWSFSFSCKFILITAINLGP